MEAFSTLLKESNAQQERHQREAKAKEEYLEAQMRQQRETQSEILAAMRAQQEKHSAAMIRQHQQHQQAIANVRKEAKAQQERHQLELIALTTEAKAQQQRHALDAKAQHEYLQNEMKELKALIANGLRREEPPKRCGPLLTVRTPCPPSVYTISYAANGAASVRGHEKFFDLPDGEKKYRPFHLPNAAIRSGDMCLVEFGITAQEDLYFKNGGLTFGFTAASVACQTEPLLDYLENPSIVMFNMYGTSLWGGPEDEFEFKKITSFNRKRRVAMLFHRTSLFKARVRIFVTENGSFGETAAPYDDEDETEFALNSSLAYIPCGNVFDKATCTIFSVALNNDIPPQFLAHS